MNWGGFTCCLGAVALYLLSRITGRDPEILKSVTRVYKLKDLEKRLEEERPLIIGVSGRVGSDSPIKSGHSGILGVIVVETVEKHFLKRNWDFSWVKDCALMKPISKQVSWYLEDGTGRVNVVGAQGATGFALTVRNEIFEKSEPASFVRGTLDSLRGFKMLGVRRIEHVLPLGTRLTVIGKMVNDGIGDVRIQKPEQGPFYVSPVPLITSSVKWSRRLKHASMGLTLLGLLLISKTAVEYFLDTSARSEERATKDVTSRDDDALDLCVICLEQKYNAAFVPCGHLCCCITCSMKLKGENCPLCRTRIDRVLKIYRH